jgi:Zn-dependent oligopeptidase
MTNPFFSASTLPFGLPPFADISDEHYRPGFDKGFTEQLAEIDRIVSSTEPATFENTFLPLERSGQVLHRVASVFYNKSSADSTEFTNELEEEIAPLYAAHSDAILLNAQLFARIAEVHGQLDRLDLDAESRYLVERYYAEFTIAGAGLDDDDKDTLRDYNKRLSSLTTRFEKNLLADSNELAVVVDDVARGGRDLGGRAGRGRPRARGQVPRDARAADGSSVSRVAHRPGSARAAHERVTGPRIARQRVRQPRPRARDHPASRRPRPSARV